MRASRAAWSWAAWLAACRAADPFIWPLPRFARGGGVDVGVSYSEHFFDIENADSDVVAAAVSRYAALTFPHRAAAPGGGAGVSALKISVVEAPAAGKRWPGLATDESYNLTISASGAALRALTEFGALRGLETFSQLVEFDFDTRAYVIHGAPWAIQDAPRFPHRGLMVDTARHFQPVSALKATVDALSYAKCNVLHWHMSDSQSFPLEVISRPRLWAGAWSKRERYLQADVSDVVEFARLRGVRVVVEFDVPGHAASWCAGYPEVCPSADCREPLDVAKEETFALIAGVLGEAAALFPDEMIHLGGDEVNTKCWTETPATAAWMAQQNLTADGAYAYFTKRAAATALDAGKRPVQWSEVYDHFGKALDERTVVHVWKSNTNVTQVVADGYDVLLNVGYTNESWCAAPRARLPSVRGVRYLDNLGVPWDALYAKEPCANIPDKLCHRVLGGHGEMWGETVDASDLQQTVWPRQAAIAERLWSPRAANDAAAARGRLARFRCLLNERGVAAAPIGNAQARQGPPGPGSCYDQ